MKNKDASFWLPLGILLLCMASGIQELRSQNTLAPDDSKQISGSALKLEEVTSKAEVVFVGTITGMGSEALLPPTASDAGPLYNGVKVTVSQILRGSVDAQTTVTIFVNFGLHEKLHAVGSSYIFFAIKNGKIDENNPDPYTVLKLLTADDANIAKVKPLIAATPAAK